MRCSGTARGFGCGSGTVFVDASDRLTLHTNPNAVTSGRTRGTRFQPSVEIGWADAARVQGIPLIAAGAKPFVLFTWRPAAERAADARFGRTCALLFVAFQNN
jgi:hypothetical protein